MSIEWKPAYSVHIPDIDSQHMKMIEMSSRLLKLVLASSEPDENVRTLLNDLKAYTIYHFDFEEALLTDASYSDLVKHINAHRQFSESIAEFERQAGAGLTKGLLLELLEFLTDWIATHIMIEDKAYAKELLGK